MGELRFSLETLPEVEDTRFLMILEEVTGPGGPHWPHPEPRSSAPALTHTTGQETAQSCQVELQGCSRGSRGSLSAPGTSRVTHALPNLPFLAPCSSTDVQSSQDNTQPYF